MVAIASLFLEHELHSTLPPIAMAAIVHAFKEYCGGGGGGSADFAALAAPYVFAFLLAMGVRLVGLAPLRFGARGGWQGRSLGVGAREQRRENQRWRRGGANNSGGNGAALLAVPHSLVQ